MARRALSFQLGRPESTEPCAAPAVVAVEPVSAAAPPQCWVRGIKTVRGADLGQRSARPLPQWQAAERRARSRPSSTQSWRARPSPMWHDGPPLCSSSFFGLSAGTRDMESLCLGSGVGPQACLHLALWPPPESFGNSFPLNSHFPLKNFFVFLHPNQKERKLWGGSFASELLALEG